MKPLVALLVMLSLTACFPNSAKHRTYAKLGEGAALASGIGMLYMVNSGADCDQMRTIDDDASGCRSNATILGTVGLSLILAGLVGFIATVSTSPEDQPEPITQAKTTTVSQPAAATK
jgi:hypothetical protein